MTSEIELVGSEVEINREFSERLGLPFPLRQYQWEGVSFLAKSESALLADEMGLGKTVQTIVAIRLALNSPSCNRVLIVAPSSLKLNWYKEVRKWAPDIHAVILEGNQSNRLAYYSLPVPVLISSYEQIQSDIGSFYPGVNFDIVVLDEAQRVKNANSITSLACKLLPRKKSWTLTGTPLENSPSDLISIFSFIKQGIIYKGMPLYDIHSTIQPYFLRRIKKNVLKELPPIIFQEIPLEINNKQKDVYDKIWENRLQDCFSKNRKVTETNLLAIITKLKQICNFDSASNESSKLEVLMELLDSINSSNEKVIVFSQYVKTLKWLSDQINCMPCLLYHGKISQDKRDSIITDFENSKTSKVLLISLKAGGVGLNLKSASTVVLFDRWWNPAVEDQAIHRAHRFGRGNPLQVITFTVQNTIEERISNILEHKRKLFKNVIENAKNTEIKGFTHQELMNILQINFN